MPIPPTPNRFRPLRRLVGLFLGGTTLFSGCNIIVNELLPKPTVPKANLSSNQSSQPVPPNSCILGESPLDEVCFKPGVNKVFPAPKPDGTPIFYYPDVHQGPPRFQLSDFPPNTKAFLITPDTAPIGDHQPILLENLRTDIKGTLDQQFQGGTLDLGPAGGQIPTYRKVLDLMSHQSSDMACPREPKSRAPMPYQYALLAFVNPAQNSKFKNESINAFGALVNTPDIRRVGVIALCP